MSYWSRTRTSGTSPKIIKRTAIDFFGRLGWLYNGCQDRVVGPLNFILENPSDQLHQITQCVLVKYNHNQNQNLLELIDIDKELRLSLLLNLTPKNGIATIINHPYLINEYTRILRYSYIYREEKFPYEIQNIREWLPIIIPETNATHIITSISWGIDIIIILQLPPNDNIVKMIDLTLEKYRSYLNGDRNDFKRTLEDISSIEKIIDTKIYSNIPALTRMTTLHDLFHNISRYRIDDTQHERLTYTLCPIQLFYSQYPTSNYVYIPLNSTNNTKLQQYLLKLLISIKTLEICFNENMPNLLCGHFKDRLTNIYKQWSVLKKEYINVIEQFADLVIDIRCGLIRISMLNKKLKNKIQIDIKNRINNLTHNMIDLEEFEKNSKLRLIYADFSYCNYQLHNMIILPFNKNQNIKKSKQKNVLSRIYTPSLTKTFTSTSQSTTETINILLLGEIGVGKSTFINALANHLTFKTLDKAQSNKPIVVIPVSFLITAGDNSNEYTVKSSGMSNSKNEDFDHPGQSITQRCKSYIYNLSETRKLRIIDTPGLGDTRGKDQDDRNIQHILNYIKKFHYLNAICFLLKSNESKLNIFFQSCLTQLFHLLGPNIRDNIIFCFTNTRSNLYTPGNTGLILKDILSLFTIHQIPFKKKNIFCFDNESFRYLMALENKIPLNNHDKQVYEMSWTNSVIETKRLIHFIHKKLTVYPIPNENEAIKVAEIKIVHLTRSMIETMRYILRKIIIKKMNSLKLSIESYEIQNDDYNYQHLPHQPILLDFLQDYKIENNSSSQKQDDMIDHLSLICHISAELGHFLMNVARYRNENPFRTGLIRLIREENDLCEDQNRNYMNLLLVDGLKSLMRNYEQRIQIIKSDPKQITLTDIYERIKYISEYPLVSEYVIDSCRTNITDDFLF